MFVCDICHKSTKANEDCHKLVVETRPKIYKHKEMVGRFPHQTERIHETKGHEIVRELKLCTTCYMIEKSKYE